MPILLKMNLHCNFACRYCYENPIKPGFLEEIDLDAVEATIDSIYTKAKEIGREPKITVHGGEPLTYPKDVLDHLLGLAFDLTGRSGIQTNGYLIDDDHIEMFKAYKTGVGISIDGPWPLNELRGIGSREERIQQTTQVFRNIDKLLENKISVSIIAVIHKFNALGERREILKQWVKDMTAKQIQGRLNPCCSGNQEIDLTPEEAVEAYSDIYEYMAREGVWGWSPFKDMTASLKGESNVVCVFRDCDPFCTSSAHTILKDGSEAVCLRLYIDEKGRKYLRDSKVRNLRSDVLRQTDCKDCKWWNHCKGGCSGLSINFDWRNKDRYCLMYKTLFERISNTMQALKIKAPECKAPSVRPSGRPGDHWDGFEHIDGDTRHLDSDIKEGDHTDGIVHIDGPMIHQDGIVHEDSE